MLITDSKKINEYYKALINKDPDFVGVFYVGVKTTSIFCISTCTARKPKRENVEFYKKYKSALENGYRPCKICRPTENSSETPLEVEQAIALVRANLKEKITDHHLKQKNISPDKVRRWFKSNYGITFHAFQRMYRINNAFIELKQGDKVIDIAMNTAYESLSGFAYTYKKIIGHSPNKNMTKDVILIHRFMTPIGPMFVCSTDQGICLLEFTNRRMLETEFQDLQKRLNAPVLMGENQHIKQVKRELAEYFSGVRKHFDVALHPVGTDFQKLVWKGLMDIPYGETNSYLQQAIAMARPKAVRAIASANGCNKIAIIIPCHRVIGSDGKLTGYGGGLERKQWLLDLESVQ